MKCYSSSVWAICISGLIFISPLLANAQQITNTGPGRVTAINIAEVEAFGETLTRVTVSFNQDLSSLGDCTELFFNYEQGTLSELYYALISTAKPAMLRVEFGYYDHDWYGCEVKRIHLSHW